MPVLQFCNCLVSIKHDGFGKRLCLSAKINYTVSCNISLYRDTKEVIYRYTQNVYRPISNSYTIKAKELAMMTKNTPDQQVKLTIGSISPPNSS